MKRTYSIIICIVLLSCGNRKEDVYLSSCGEEQMPKYDYRATVQGEMTPKLDSMLRIEKRRDVFKPCRTVVYSAKLYSKNQELLTNEIITIRSTGKRWEHQIEKQDEIIIKYDFNNDSIGIVNSYQLNKTRINPNWLSLETTGVIENVERIWTHPFRSNQYNFTQVAPFPQIELPLRIGKKWTDNSISLGESFGDWANMKVNSEFEIIEKSDIQTKYGEFKNSWKIKAVSKFPLGESELVYWFNEKYGFVKLNYTNYGAQILTIEVIDIKETAGSIR